MRTQFLQFLPLALALCIAVPFAAAHAQQLEPSTQTPPTDMRPSESHMWEDESFNRRELREEMEQIRNEHEELVDEKTVLQNRCAGATGQHASECDEQRQAIALRCLKLRERVHALHERIAALRQHAPNTQASNDLPVVGGKSSALLAPDAQ